MRRSFNNGRAAALCLLQRPVVLLGFEDLVEGPSMSGLTFTERSGLAKTLDLRSFDPLETMYEIVPDDPILPFMAESTEEWHQLWHGATCALGSVWSVIIMQMSSPPESRNVPKKPSGTGRKKNVPKKPEVEEEAPEQDSEEDEEDEEVSKKPAANTHKAHQARLKRKFICDLAGKTPTFDPDAFEEELTLFDSIQYMHGVQKPGCRAQLLEIYDKNAQNMTELQRGMFETQFGHFDGFEKYVPGTAGTSGRRGRSAPPAAAAAAAPAPAPATGQKRKAPVARAKAAPLQKKTDGDDDVLEELAVAVDVPAELGQSSMRVLKTNVSDAVTESLRGFNLATKAQLEGVATTVQLQSMIQEVGALQSLRGEVSTIASSVKTALDNKDQMIALTAKLSAAEQRQVVLQNMLSGLIRDQSAAESCLMTFAPLVQSGTFSKDEVKSFFTNCWLSLMDSSSRTKILGMINNMQ